MAGYPRCYAQGCDVQVSMIYAVVSPSEGIERMFFTREKAITWIDEHDEYGLIGYWIDEWNVT